MKLCYVLPLALLSLMPALLSGCGSDTGQAPAGTAVADSQQCISTSCHGGDARSISQVTGALIVDEWKRSLHYTRNAAGCRDCHVGGHHTPASCGVCHGATSPPMVSNPDADGECLKCHTAASLGQPHFNSYTGVTHSAQFVDLQNVGRCRNCHNPHDTTMLPEATAWAGSAHGNVNGPAWSAEDFKAVNGDCLRCHTAAGYVNYVTGGFALPVAPLAPSKTYGVLGCNACHTTYAFGKSIRPVARPIAPYNSGNSPRTFPDVGATNICIPCHAGRESGDTVQAVTDFTNVGFKNPHYMAAAGLLYMTTGFTGFTSSGAAIGATTYGKTLTPDASVPGGISGGVNSTHRRLGTTAINADTHNAAFFLPGNLDTNGPCVTCHMNGYTIAGTSRPTSHTLAINADAFNQVCSKCHTSEGGTPLTADNFQKVFLEPQSEVFLNALALAVSILEKRYGIKYDPARYPYFYDVAADPSANTAVKDWTRGTKNQALGRKVMGACFNINLLKRDPAAYVHARTYTRRLVYDTIDFLDDGTLNLSVSATAVAANPVLYGKGAQAYTDKTLTALSPGTTESMVYLIGWSRSTGAWNTPERP